MIGKPEHDSRECDGVFRSGKVAWIGGITIIILSMGMPGIPGAGVICMTVLLQQLQVPTESVSLVESSLGTCIVCDTGGFASGNSQQLDIAVTW